MDVGKQENASMHAKGRHKGSNVIVIADDADNIIFILQSHLRVRVRVRTTTRRNSYNREREAATKAGGRRQARQLHVAVAAELASLSSSRARPPAPRLSRAFVEYLGVGISEPVRRRCRWHSRRNPMAVAPRDARRYRYQDDR